MLPALLGASRALINHPEVRDLYPEYLFTSHCIIRASVPLMKVAHRQARTMEDDGVSGPLANYLEKHIPEELDHDEWLLDDLEMLGHDRSTILSRPPSPTVAGLVGAQYYWIYHYHPVALLGYIALLEGYPPTVEMIDELVGRTGYAREAFRTMLRHAELDPGHKQELDEALDSLPLTSEQSAVLGLSAMYTTDLLSRAIEEVVERD
jgi:hypothetical protein